MFKTIILFLFFLSTSKSQFPKEFSRPSPFLFIILSSSRMVPVISNIIILSVVCNHFLPD